ncbi:MAG TPA: trypsin-like peptidase domain-containing protein [Bradyrhizobium sp.]|jgi:S1-C subfamily serine protease|uniref:S1C family serine protease n=1 Tax=Bradyrhizobium sp. TaxID=376 RepID=UPI002CE60164|nr:trypsin-like peptidase domain-containing protein [Bradyrhizobium sp.]HTB01174.1 trypsin-like peptidase domain-containing protein [Bradyrhizobium sp.]
MRLVTLALSSLILLASLQVAQAAGPFGNIRVGAWTGGAYTDDNSGAFSHCAAATSYLNGVNVIVGQNANSSWLLGFGNQAFHLTAGETFPIDVTFDGQAQVRLFGTAVSPALVTAILPPHAAQQLRKASLMVALAKGATYQFNLTSTGPLLPVLANCVAKTKSAGVSNAGDFSVPPPKAGTANPVVASATPGPSQTTTAKKIDKSGTGFVVSSNGHILTNQHVIDGCVGEIHGNLSGESPMALRIVSTDETNDLALLQGTATSLKDVATIREKAIHPGDAVVAIGYPFHGLLTSDFTVTTGIVSSLSGVFNDTRYLQISAAVQPGNSGGPLLDSSGHVVGMVAAKLNAIKFAKATGDIPENINFAIKTGALRDFLDNSVVSYQTAGARDELKTADMAHDARAYTLLISCTATEQTETAKK